MPVNTTSSTKQFTGDGVQKMFPFTFPISSSADLVVKERVTATGVPATKTLGTHYTVTHSGKNFDNGGNVVMIAAPAATDTLIITRATTQTQSTDLNYGDTHDSESYEDMVDKNTRMIQELQAQIDRCIKIPDSDAETLETELPNSIDRASQYSGFDAAGEPIAAATFASYGAASAFIQTLLDDATASAARETLLEWDLIVDSVADLELLNTDDAVQYPRVLIKHGTYATTDYLDFAVHGVKYLRGERPDTTISLAPGEGDVAVQLDDAGVYENFTVLFTGTAGAGNAEGLQPETTASNNTIVRDVYVYGTGTGQHQWNAFMYILGGLVNCRAFDCAVGFKGCKRLANCQTSSCTHATGDFLLCDFLVNCLADTSVKGYHDCNYLTNCEANAQSVAAFDGCDFLTGCYGHDVTAAVDIFQDCNYIAGCHADTTAGDGFSASHYIAATLATGIGGAGFAGTCSLVDAGSTDTV